MGIEFCFTLDVHRAPNHQINATAEKLRFSVPSSLRSSAARYLGR